MATRLTPEQKQQELARHYALVQATLNYMQQQLSASPDPALAAHFQALQTEATEHFQRKRLARLQQWLRDLAEPPLATDATRYTAYLQQATGLPVNLQSQFERRLAAICQRRRIRTRAEYDDVRAAVDVWPFAAEDSPEEQARLELLQDMVSAYEGFIASKDIGRPRPFRPQPAIISRQLLSLPSPDGEKVLSVRESGYEGEPESQLTSVMLNFPRLGGGAGVVAFLGFDLGVRAYWADDFTVVLVLRAGTTSNRAKYGEEPPTEMYSQLGTVRVQYTQG